MDEKFKNMPKQELVKLINSGSNLRGSDLSYSNLSGSNLSGSDLRYSDLRGSNLSYSDLRGSDLSYSDLSGSNLSGSNLSYSDLSYSNLSGSNLSYSDLRGSNLSGSDLSYSDLRGSNLSYSDLSYSNLSGSNLSGSDLRYSDLRGSKGVCQLYVSGMSRRNDSLTGTIEDGALVIRAGCWNNHTGGSAEAFRERVLKDHPSPALYLLCLPLLEAWAQLEVARLAELKQGV